MHQVINGYLFAAPASASVDYAYAENLSTVGGGGSVFTTLAELALTPEAADYAIFWQTNGARPTTTLGIEAKLVDDVTDVQTFDTVSGETTPADKHCAAGLAFITGDGSTARSLKLQGFLAGTSEYSQSRITALKLGADDETAYHAAEQTNDTTTFSTLLTLNFTPPSAGDYYIIYHVKTSGAGAPAFRFGDGTTTFGGAGTRLKGAFIGFTKLTGVAGAQTCTIEGRSNFAGNIARFKDCAILALRADRFADTYFSGVVNGSDGTDTTYTTVQSQTFTPDAADHLTLMASYFDGSSASVSGYMRALDDAEVLSEAVMEASALRVGLFGHQVEEYAAVSRTQALQRKAETTGNTVRPIEAAILCLSLDGMTSA